MSYPVFGHTVCHLILKASSPLVYVGAALLTCSVLQLPSGRISDLHKPHYPGRTNCLSVLDKYENNPLSRWHIKVFQVHCSGSTYDLHMLVFLMEMSQRLKSFSPGRN